MSLNMRKLFNIKGMMFLSSLCVIAFVVVANVGFARQDPIEPDLPVPTVVPGGRASNGHEEVQLKIGRFVDGFGGWYLDGKTLVVNLQNPQDVTYFRDVIVDLGKTDSTGLSSVLEYVTEIQAVPSQFLFSDLIAWKDAISQHFFANPQLVSVDADERANKVTLGVSDAKAIPALEELAKTLGVAEEALSIIVETEPTVRMQTKLNQAWTPPAAGVQIRPASGGYCTLGMGVLSYYLGWQQGYLTAAHCINDITLTHGVTGPKFYQPAPGRPYGGVFLNTPWSSTDPSCGGYALCTTADVMVLTGMLPNVARHVKNTLPGSIVVTGQDSVEASIFPSVGLTNLRRVGATSGTSTGDVLATCENRVSTGPLGPLMNLCVDRIGGSVSPGDSGGLTTWPNALGKHQFMGIVLAGAPGGYIISGWLQIMATVGYFSTLPD